MEETVNTNLEALYIIGWMIPTHGRRQIIFLWGWNRAVIDCKIEELPFHQKRTLKSYPLLLDASGGKDAGGSCIVFSPPGKEKATISAWKQQMNREGCSSEYTESDVKALILF